MWRSEIFRAQCKVWLLIVYLKLMVIVITALGCQQAPTKIRQTAVVEPNLLVRNAAGPVRIDAETILIDARLPFDYSMAHAPGAINLQWQDFAQPQADVPGHLPRDLNALAQRLSLLGISPDSSIVVVGKGRGGLGEEGRVAWSLIFLGIKNVQTIGADYFRSGMTNAEPAPRPNGAIWRPMPDGKMVADRKEVLAIATAKKPASGPSSARLLDVRSRKEYFLKGGQDQDYVFPELGALHIPWEQFINEEGRPNSEMRAQLQSLGWHPADRIVVISTKGVRSGAVAFALMSLGFTNVANYTGGYTELMKMTKARGPKERPPGK